MGGRAGASRPEPGDEDDDTVNLGKSTASVGSSSSTDAASLSTLAMIILSYNKNDARLAIDNVRQGIPLLCPPL